MNHLLKLLADNRGRGQFRAEATGDEATIYIYDAIVSDDYWGGVSAQSFVNELHAITAPVIHLRINCPGGDVFAARAMEQAVREHPSQIIAHVDGYAASAASYLALAADDVRITEGGFFMIHKAWTIAFGNANDLIHTADLLEKIDGTLVKSYANATGQDPEQIALWMAEETWFTAEESVKYGFAKSIDESKTKASASAFNLSAYARAPAPKNINPALDPPEPAPTWDVSALLRQIEIVEKTA